MVLSFCNLNNAALVASGVVLNHNVAGGLASATAQQTIGALSAGSCFLRGGTSNFPLLFVRADSHAENAHPEHVSPRSFVDCVGACHD
jgi:hypothetical protein